MTNDSYQIKYQADILSQILTTASFILRKNYVAIIPTDVHLHWR